MPLLAAFDLGPLLTGLAIKLHLPVIGLQAAGTVLALILAGWIALIACKILISDRQSKLFREVPTLPILGLTGGLIDLTMLTVLIGLGANISFDGRLARVDGLLLFPVMLRIAIVASKRPGLFFRGLVLTVVLVAIAAIPAAYGAVIGPYNIWRGPRQVDADGIIDPALGIVNQQFNHDVNNRQFFERVRAEIPSDAIVYTVYPWMAFPLRDRRLIVIDSQELYTAAELGALQYRGRPKGGVALLIPVEFASNGKLTAVESSFVDLHHWTSQPQLPDPQWTIWLGEP